MTRSTFNDDLVEIAADALRAGRLARRDFLKVLGAAGLLPAVGAGLGALPFGSSPAAAKAAELVLCNFGGDAVAGMGEAWGKPFTADTGIPVRVDGGSPLAGKIKAMVESGSVSWDICDGDGFLCNQLGKQGLLEEVDYGVVDKSLVRDGWAWPHGIANYTYSFVLAYRKDMFPDKPPTYADFFDTAKYPGKRTMWKYQMGAMEACLLGDGVKRDALYPADLDRAIAKARSLGDDVIYWESGASSQQMFLDGEVVMGNIWNTRASILERDTQGAVTWTWNDGVFCPSSFVIPKGNPAGSEAAQKFMASMLDPARQIKLLQLLGNGPSNPAASAMLPPELRRIDPGYADNVAVQAIRSEEWYEMYYDAAVERWIDGISG
ncbi:ABC transporter substrate-binding protein (plasmid) [Skermanella sp. TT6]|uniref:ABC transporter substrate-binding protein n=1 Tax=Skermanella cutis TaxID=2775420 RepID=A0ABX7BEJ6_9PROT|nr:ABC transporter substrate-binding protein [Skermanella sp. TT6]QQP92816.1 ABC transporter substrate-binding protein [Skermanella sp. TT6]